MALRLLLFTSDSDTALVLAKLLAEFDMQVEFCSEMLASVEKVTQDNFDAIVVDWDLGPEATFLLKTARELKSTRECLAFALVSDAAGAACAVQIGAHGILNKPLVPEQIRETLGTIRELIASRQNGPVPNPAPSPTLQADAPLQEQRKYPQESKIEEPTTSGPTPAEDGDRKLRHLVRKPRELPSLPPLPKAEEPSQEEAYTGALFSSLPYSQPTGKSSSRRKRKTGTRLAVVALLLVGMAFLYVWAPGSGYFERLSSLAKGVFTRKQRPQQPEQTTVDPTLALPDVRSTAASGVNKTAVRDPFTPASEESNDESDANIQVIPVMNPADSATPTATVAQPSSSEASAQPEEGQPSSAGQGVPANTIKVQPVAIARGPAAIARPSATVDHSRAQLPQSLKLSNPINPVQTASTTPPIVSSALTPVVLPEETAKQLLLNQVQPVYPDQALRAGLQGAVVLQAWIARDGSVRDVKLVRGSFVLARAAVEAVRQWHYKPYYVNGQAVEAQTVITVNFRLPTSSLNSGKSVEAISSVVQDTAKP